MSRLRIILCLIYFLTISQCFSQGLEIELIARPALTSLRGDDMFKENYDLTLNFSTGIGLNYLLTESSILNFSILYDKKGARGESIFIWRENEGQVTGEGIMKNELNFDYLTIPIQWNKRFGQKIKYQFGIGIYTSFILKQTYISKGPEGLPDSNQENTDKFKSLDFGLSASFTVLVPIHDKFSIKTGLDNNLGLINVADFPTDGNGIKHNAIGISVGLNYTLK